MTNGESPAQPCSFDEFKLYYESTEKVTDRRLNANRWNYSITVGILLAIAAIYSWSTDNRDFYWLAAIAILVLAGTAALFCLFWLRQVEDWKALNNAKFKVLSDMANRLEFQGPTGPSEAKSFRPFDEEWKILSAQRGLRKVRVVRLGQIEALNASGAELFMPRAFMALFGVLFFAVLVATAFSWSSLPHEIAPGNPSISPSSSPSASASPAPSAPATPTPTRTP